jgi:redox-sensitive bicupin YhaK (pirin superfamily)
MEAMKATPERVGPAPAVYRHGSAHMVGDGFPVRNLIPSGGLGERLSPFLLLDYAGPADFPPTDRPRGVGEHPHRGFETVTLLYQGVVAHRDSAGHGGIIGPGDVQWMTAGSGVVHEEMHERDFARRGGTLEAIQLWVNLPKAFKLTPPCYQTLGERDIPVVELTAGAGRLRVIAGSYRGVTGPARTFTPVQLYDLRVSAGRRVELALPAGQQAALFVLRGPASVNGSAPIGEATLAAVGDSGAPVLVEAEADATILVMAGEPIREPVARYGPFVMNTQEELVQAVRDYQAGRMGRLD